MINYRNNRRNRFKSNTDRNFRKRQNNGHKNHNDFNNNNDFRHRNPGRNNQNAAKLVDKYNNLAREALSSGDKILSENYLQHADHFSRILSMQELNKPRNENNNIIEQNFTNDKYVMDSSKNEDIDIDKKNVNNLNTADKTD
tara:strand:+ start:2928 stop:3353 length:426 start_codon:yes stop_codon:yes gene_type:complete